MWNSERKQVWLDAQEGEKAGDSMESWSQGTMLPLTMSTADSNSWGPVQSKKVGPLIQKAGKECH